jgi:peptidoglycan/LPS O-acetylase OafA/YrhL
LLVFATHLHELTTGAVYPAYQPWVRAGYVGVSLFFILSGFVLVWADGAAMPPRTFYRRRLARIYPNHVATWLLAVTLFIAWATPISPVSAVLNLLLLQAWVPSSQINFGLNGVAWSLSCEAFFYLMFPLLIRWMNPLSARAQRRLLLCAGGLVVALPAALWPLGSFQPDAPHLSFTFWLLYVCPLTRLAEFVVGMLLALQIRAGWRPPVTLPVAAALAVGGWLVADYAGALSIAAVTLIPFALLISAAATADINRRPTVFASRVCVLLGELSYAFYLLHQLLIRAAEHTIGLFGTWPATALGAMTLLAITITASALLYRLVEHPARRLITQPARRGS